MAGPNHITPGTPENQVELPVGTRMEVLTGRVINNGRRAVMGTLAGLAMAISSPAMAQDMVLVKAEAPQGALTPNPEFDRIIAEAQKAGKDPLDYTEELRKAGKLTFTQGRELRKYYSEITATNRRAELGRLEVKKAELLVRVNAENIKLIGLIEERKRKGLLNQADKTNLMEIYEDKVTTSEEVRELIRKKFGDVLNLRDLVAGV